MTEHAFTIDLLDITKIEPRESNPQQGDIGAIALAIAVDGWHGSVIAQDRGRSKPVLVAGEHRWRALRMLQENGIEINGQHRTYDDLLAEKSLLLPPPGKIPGQVLKMDDTRAVRKMLADNRASALALADESEMAALLQELASTDMLLGSLFDGDDLDALLDEIERAGRPIDTTNEVQTPNDRLADYAEAGIRSVILPMKAAEYDALVAALARLRTAWGLESNTEVVIRAVAEADADG